MTAFDSLPLELVQRIALAGVALDLAGLPGLFALLCTCRAVHLALQHVHFHAQLFKLKFDLEAASTRFSERWLTSRCLASELKKRWATLQRVKSKDYTGGVDDLFTIYLMLLEGDGRNETQLFDYADVPSYILGLVLARRNTPDWYGDTEGGTALCASILWIVQTRGAITLESAEDRHAMLGSLQPFLMESNRFSTIYAPDTHHDLPLLPRIKIMAAHASGPRPFITTITHYSHQLRLFTPPVVPAAMLVMMTRIEANFGVNTPTYPPNHPPTRAAALSVGYHGPSIEDLEEFRRETRVNYLERTTPTFLEDEDDVEDDVVTGSARFDPDWYKLVSCLNPWSMESPLRGAVYRLGSIAHEWGGRYIVIEADGTGSQNFAQRPIYVKFAEHHSLDASSRVPPGDGAWPVPPGHESEEFGDDVLNAWLPRNIHVYEAEEAIDIVNPVTNTRSRYHTYFPDRKSHYSKSATEASASPPPRAETPPSVPDKDYLSDEEAESGTATMVVGDYIDDDEWEDTVAHKSTGVSDIIITGRTPARYAQAWGDFTYLGRVRAWDGLIVLLRRSAHPHAHDQSRWIFKGYVHHGNFVGRWRDTTTAASTVRLESGFILGKQ